MAYNLGRSFKDVLKVISLGVMASINGVSGDVFAMEDERFPGGRGFNRHHVLDFQGNLDPDTALQMAMELSCQGDRVDLGAEAVAEGPHFAGFQGADPRPQAADDDEDWKLAIALQFEGDLNAGLDQGARPQGAAAAEDDDEDFKFAQALQLEEEFKAGFHDEGAYPRGAAAAVTKAKDWDVDPTNLSRKEWISKDLAGEGFVTYISRQSVVLFEQLKGQRAQYLLEEAIPAIAARLKVINTGIGVSDIIDQILRDI